MKSLLASVLVGILSISSPGALSAQLDNPDGAPRADHERARALGGMLRSPDPEIQNMVNGVSTEALVTSLRTLQDFGTRYDFSPQREACTSWLLNQYEQLGLETHAEPFTYVSAQITDVDIISSTCAYVVGDSYLLAKTTDGGATWNQLPPTGAQFGNYDCADFIDEGHGWVVDGLGNCFKTSNGGNSWLRIYIASKQFHAIAFLNSTTGLAVGEGGAFYRTVNGGSTWSPCTAAVGNIALRGLKWIDARHCWAAGDSGAILTSQDAGLTWTRQLSPAKSSMYGVDFVDSLRGWAVGGTGYWTIEGGEGVLLKTTDGGQTWTELPVPSGAKCLAGVCALDSLHVLIADPRGKLFLSTDGGEFWQMKLDLTAGSMRRLALRFRGDGSSHIGFVGREGLLYISGDGGASWQDRTLQLPANLIHTSSNVVATIPGEVTPEKEFLLLAHYDSRSGTSMSFAPGVNDNGSGTSLVLEAARACSGYRFASTLRFLAVSAEELGLIGSSVYVRAMLQRGANLIGAVNADMVGYPVTGDTLRLVAGSYQMPNALGDSIILYQMRYGIDAHVTAAVDSSPSSDHVPLSQAGYSAVWLSEGTTTEVAGHDPYLHKAADTLGNLMPGMVRRATQLAVATAAEFARPLGLSEVRSQPKLPTQMSLWQNYPNPFNPTTTIRYALPQRGRVTITVYNMLGQKVAELARGKDIEAGYHEVTFDGSNLASGVYLCRMQAGSFVGVRKLLLMR